MDATERRFTIIADAAATIERSLRELQGKPEASPKSVLAQFEDMQRKLDSAAQAIGKAIDDGTIAALDATTIAAETARGLERIDRRRHLFVDGAPCPECGTGHLRGKTFDKGPNIGTSFLVCSGYLAESAGCDFFYVERLK